MMPFTTMLLVTAAMLIAFWVITGCIVWASKPNHVLDRVWGWYFQFAKRHGSVFAAGLFTSVLLVVVMLIGWTGVYLTHGR